ICAACSVTSEADVSKQDLLAIDAGTLFTPEQKFAPGRLLIQGTTIAAVGTPDQVRLPVRATRIDASALLVTPGFIDPHVHGASGIDVMEGTFESINSVS